MKKSKNDRWTEDVPGFKVVRAGRKPGSKNKKK